MGKRYRQGTEPAGRLLTDEQRRDWLRLIRSENVGPATFRDLLNFYGSAAAALDALPHISSRTGKKTIEVANIDDISNELSMIDKLGAQLIAMGEPGYPPMLRHIDAPPPLLCVHGSKQIFDRPFCAIVGGRGATRAGREFAERLGKDLGQAGFAIASGLAYGVDAAAHKGSLQTGTVAVFAGGVDFIYPYKHSELVKQIFDQGGAVISEMPMGHNPNQRDFPRRNRLISGISYGVVVIEAAERSGSLHTANYAIEQGRSVFAAPASPLNEKANGSNNLIRNGAQLVINAQQILDDLTPMIENTPPAPLEIEETQSSFSLVPPLENDRNAIIASLGPDPVSVDILIRDMHCDPAVMRYTLMELELTGRLERHSGNRISLV